MYFEQLVLINKLHDMSTLNLNFKDPLHTSLVVYWLYIFKNVTNKLKNVNNAQLVIYKFKLY